MNDCISRQAVLGHLCTHCPDVSECFEDCVDIKRIKAIPSVTPTVIEDIKAEINEGIENYKNKDKAVMYGFMCALYIIDKHVEGWEKE